MQPIVEYGTDEDIEEDAPLGPRVLSPDRDAEVTQVNPRAAGKYHGNPQEVFGQRETMQVWNCPHPWTHWSQQWAEHAVCLHEWEYASSDDAPLRERNVDVPEERFREASLGVVVVVARTPTMAVPVPRAPVAARL